MYNFAFFPLVFTLIYKVLIITYCDCSLNWGKNTGKCSLSYRADPDEWGDVRAGSSRHGVGSDLDAVQ